MLFEKDMPDKKIPEKHKNLLSEIKKVKEELDSAYTMFEYSNEPELTQSAIHEINACQIRYEYLLKEAKKQGLMVKNIRYHNS